jgi:hypothetical protein
VGQGVRPVLQKEVNKISSELGTVNFSPYPQTFILSVLKLGMVACAYNPSYLESINGED